MAKKESNLQEIIAEIAAQQFHPVYFFMGEEPYYIDFLTDYLIEHFPMSEEEREFNLQILYGTREVSTAQIISTARHVTMFGDRQLIVVREAQQIRNFEDEFLAYVKAPMPSSVVVVNYKGKTIDKRKKLAAELMQNACLFESKKLYDNQIPAWISDYARNRGMQIEEKASQMLAEFLGNDLGRIVGEINKLNLILSDKKPTDASKKPLITPELIERNIGVSKDYNNFELIDALKQKDILKAETIAHHFSKNPKDNPLVLTLVVLYDFFSKLLIYQYLVDKSPSAAASRMGVAPFQVRNYETGARYYTRRQALRNIRLIREYDAKSKGYRQAATNDGELLRELLIQLMR